MVMNSVHGCMNCLEIHIFIAAGPDKIEIKHQNMQRETVEIKQQHVQAKATSKEQSM